MLLKQGLIIQEALMGFLQRNELTHSTSIKKVQKKTHTHQNTSDINSHHIFSDSRYFRRVYYFSFVLFTHESCEEQ